MKCLLKLPGLPVQELNIEPRKTTIEGKPQVHEDALGAIRSALKAHYARFPQYEGKFDDCVLGRLKWRSEFKGGAELEEGELVLVVPQSWLGAYLNAWETSIYCSPIREHCGFGLSVLDITIL